MAEKQPAWAEMAELLCSGVVGFELLHELRERFPRTRRQDVYTAVVIAWTYQQAGWLADACDLDSRR